MLGDDHLRASRLTCVDAADRFQFSPRGRAGQAPPRGELGAAGGLEGDAAAGQAVARGEYLVVLSYYKQSSGQAAMPEFSAYCASKHALEAYSEALRNEMRVWNVDVSIIEPGFFDTGIVRSAADQDRRVWDRLPEATRSEYGNEWFAARYIVYTGSCTGCERSTQLVALAEGSSLIWQTQ